MSSILPSILPNPTPSSIVTVTKEEFILFHSVDRKLFSRLVVELGRDTNQSTNVMAFLMWIEKKSKICNLVEEILQSCPNVMLNNLVDEVVVILNCIEISHYPNTFVGQSNLPMIQHILSHNLTLEFFHKKRLEVINDVTKLINDVCLIAFQDIIEQVQYNMAEKEQELYLANFYGGANIPHLYGAANIPTEMQQQMLYSYPNKIGMVPQQIQPDVREILANLNLDDIYVFDSGIVVPASNDDKRNEIMHPIDDRTLFMTFSKGYPISESELREFITRKFGYIIDRLIMEKVNSPEQSLYARLVVRPEAIDVIDHFLEYKPMIKFSINGKHVWARKYIPKMPPPFEPGTSRYLP